MNRIIQFFICLLIAITLALIVLPGDTKLKTDFSVSNENSKQQIDHQSWSDLLAKYLYVNDGHVSLFEYHSVSDTDTATLKTYLQNLQMVNVFDLNPSEQMAYWINLYNALTVDVVLDAYPIDSIKKINSPLLKRGPWKKKYIMVMGEKLSLDDIEHGILRSIFQDPRVHYAVNCASIGCPSLQPTAFTATNLEELLDQGAQDYINHPRGVSIVDGKLVISSLYKWFAGDFGNQQELIEHFIDYADEPLAEQLEQTHEISDYVYDWSINDREDA